MKLGILKSFERIQGLVEQYVDACKELGIEYIVLDLFSDNWIDKIRKSNVDGILVNVMGALQEHKSMFNERLYIINKELGIPIYPSLKELFLYEDKRMYEYWLTVNRFPHPKTHIFYQKKKAIQFLNDAKYPLVFKNNGGASASGVQIVKSKLLAKFYAHEIFGIVDYRLSLGKVPWKKGGIPIPKFGMAQKHYLLIQEYIPIKWEWRIIKIGDSYFGHQKLLKGNFASGSDMVGWVKPPKELLLMIKDLCEKGDFDSMAMDVLESLDSRFFINEIQSLFGSFLPYQMKIKEKPGRFIFNNGDFVFEEGEFNKFGSNLLRVKDFIYKLKHNYYRNYHT